MRFSLKLFCVALLAVGLALPACERPEEDEATAEGAEEAPVEEEEEAEDDEADQELAEEDEEDEEADADVEDEDADEADEEDAEDEEAEADEEDEDEQAAAADEDQQAQAPQKPPLVGTVEGSVSGSKIKDGRLRLTVTDDYKAHGQFSGKREDQPFVVQLQNGKVSKSDNSVTAAGSRGQTNARLSGKVSDAAVQGKLEGKIHGKDFSTRYNVSK